MKLLDPGPSVAPWCPQCGPQTKCDEDGLCATCGADMMSPESYNELRRCAGIEAMENAVKRIAGEAGMEEASE